MDITLYVNNSEKNRINKSITGITTISGTLREPTDLTNPVIDVEINSMYHLNYAYIPYFNKFYFIEKITIARNGLYTLNLHTDVLMTYKNDILNCSGIINDTSNVGTNYISNDSYQRLCKDKTDIINFPNGLSSEGEFILITAGG